MRPRSCTHLPCCCPPARNFDGILVESVDIGSSGVSAWLMSSGRVESQPRCTKVKKENVFVRHSSHLPGRGVSFLENTPKSLALANSWSWGDTNVAWCQLNCVPPTCSWQFPMGGGGNRLQMWIPRLLDSRNEMKIIRHIKLRTQIVFTQFGILS